MTTSHPAPAAITDSAEVLAEEFDVQAPSPGQVMRSRAKRHYGLIFGSTVVLIAVLVAIFAKQIAPYDPYNQDLSIKLMQPVWDAKGSWAHPFGTDSLGRDELSRVIHGSRISLTVGFLAAALASIIGSAIGMTGGYFGGRVDAVVMYLINCKLSLPPILVAVAVVSVFGGTIPVLIMTIAALFWDRYAVVTRAATQQIRNQDFVAAAEAVGCSRRRIILTEVLPNLLNHIIVIVSLETAFAIIVEAILSFFGLGVQPPTPSWGLMVNEGRAYMFFMPYLVNIPGLAIFILVIAINMMGDGIRDITAPEGRS